MPTSMPPTLFENIHKYLRAFPRLRIFIGDVVNIAVVPYIAHMAQAGRFYIYFLKSRVKRFYKLYGVIIRHIGSAEAGIVTHIMFSLGSDNISIALTATRSASVESSPPEIPITAFLSRYAQDAWQVPHFELEYFAAAKLPLAFV